MSGNCDDTLVSEKFEGLGLKEGDELLITCE